MLIFICANGLWHQCFTHCPRASSVRTDAGLSQDGLPLALSIHPRDKQSWPGTTQMVDLETSEQALRDGEEKNVRGLLSWKSREPLQSCWWSSYTEGTDADRPGQAVKLPAPTSVASQYLFIYSTYTLSVAIYARHTSRNCSRVACKSSGKNQIINTLTLY